jgi:hypothetical protein
MNINIDDKTILRDHTLKGLIAVLSQAADHDRAVRVLCEDGYVIFEILTIDDEAKLEL